MPQQGVEWEEQVQELRAALSQLEAEHAESVAAHEQRVEAYSMRCQVGEAAPERACCGKICPLQKEVSWRHAVVL